MLCPGSPVSLASQGLARATHTGGDPCVWLLPLATGGASSEGQNGIYFPPAARVTGVCGSGSHSVDSGVRRLVVFNPGF